MSPTELTAVGLTLASRWVPTLAFLTSTEVPLLLNVFAFAAGSTLVG